MFRLIPLLILYIMTVASNANAQSPKVLRACPNSPNCISSQAVDSEHHIKAFQFSVPAENAWQGLVDLLKGEQHITLIEIAEDSLHAEARSQVFGFVDDLEFILWPEQQQIHVRSAARKGYWDLGVNRKRVEDIFKTLRITLSRE